MQRRFADLLRAARLRAGLTQEQLADKSGVSMRTISDLERGRVARPRRGSVDLLLGALDLDPTTRTALLAAARSGGAEPTTAIAGPIAAPIARELPGAPNDFTGRARELEVLRHAVRGMGSSEREGPLVIVLTGRPGVGKTTLGVRLGQLIAKDTMPQLFVELGGGTQRPLPVEDALRQLLMSLGVGEDRCPGDPQQRVRRYRSLLFGKQVLIVLDDAIDESQVLPLLPAAPECVVVITSRDQLAGLAADQRIALDGWSREDAHAFLAHVARRKIGIADQRAFDEIVELCDRLPLALRIAGNWLAARPGWAPNQLAERLRDDGTRLDALSVGSVGVLPAFEFTYRRLCDDAQTVLRRLPLLKVATFGIAILPVLLSDRGDPTAAFEELVTANLVQPAPADGRYRLHDLVALYAQRRLGDEPATAIRTVRRDICRWLLERAVAAGHRLVPNGAPPGATHGESVEMFGDREEAIAWLDAELPAVLVAAEQAVELDLEEDALAAADAVSWYIDLRCRWRSWLRLCETTLPIARGRGDIGRQAALSNYIGLSICKQQRFSEAMLFHRQAATLAEQAGDPLERALAINHMGLVHSGMGAYSEAIVQHEEAAILFRSIAYPRGEGMATNHRGAALRNIGDHRGAARAYRRALELFEGLDDRIGIAMAELGIGLALVSAGDSRAAIALLREALAGFERLRDRWGRAEALYSLGLAVRAETGDAPAIALLRDAADAFSVIGSLTRERDVQLALADSIEGYDRLAAARCRARARGLAELAAAGDQPV